MSNCYLVGCPETLEGIIIDPGAEGKRIINRIADLRLKIKYIINTHGHIDHIGANSEVKAAFQAPLLVHAADAPLYRSPQAGMSFFMGSGKVLPPDYLLKDNEQLQVGTLAVKVLETPGHTPGGISLEIAEALFTGDTLLPVLSPHRPPRGSYRQNYKQHLEQTPGLPGQVPKFFPGHGPSSTNWKRTPL